MKILSVVGTRPQIVKAAVVSKAVRPLYSEVLVHTGQHYDDSMSGVFFRDLGVPTPDFNLDIGSGSHGRQTGRMLEAIEAILEAERPDLVLVYGDTNSTLAGALAASKLHVPIAHVEAGVRSFDRNMPEEINRIVTDHVSALLLAPTPSAVANLHGEGIESGVHLVGDVMLDVLAEQSDRVDEWPVTSRGFSPDKYCFMTLHRPANVDHSGRLAAILSSLNRIPLPVAFAVHPRTRGRLRSHRMEAIIPDNVSLLEPLTYMEAVAFERHAAAVVTDSGGVQREAAWLGIPCIVLRKETEWPELLGPRMVLADLPHQAFGRVTTAHGDFLRPVPGATGRIVEVLEQWAR